MNDQQLLRYSRHILLNEIGIEGQQRLLDAKALLIGLGGLGALLLRTQLLSIALRPGLTAQPRLGEPNERTETGDDQNEHCANPCHAV